MEQNTYWRQYPAIERLFAEGRVEDFTLKAADACRQLEGTATQQDRAGAKARITITAYGHLILLCKDLLSALPEA